jgi:hypothetical protein
MRGNFGYTKSSGWGSRSMIRWATAAGLFLCLFATGTAFAQDAFGEYNKAMHAYETYDYNTACSRMMNFYGATNSFHNLPPGLTLAIEKSGKSVMSLTQTAIQAENAREAGKACSDRLLQALLLAKDDQWPQVEKALALAEQAHQQMIEQMNGADQRLRAKPEQPGGPADSSLAAIVAASRGVNSGETGGCASEGVLRKDAKLNSACVSHLVMLARKQRSAGQKTMARLNYQRASEVTSYMGAKQNLVVKKEAAKAIREIEQEQKLDR